MVLAGRRAGWAQRWPPVLVLGIALALAIFALPSALVLPQASPSQTLEYAPVPPNSNNSPGGGNFAGLGLGSGSTFGSAGGAPVTPPGAGGNPTEKQCVGSPPHQTEDPLSPPCVPFFSGDNGGGTYPGVTRSEIRLVIYATGGQSLPASDGLETEPTDTEYDLQQAPHGNEDVAVRMFRILQAELNDRYQTYGRRVHIYVHYDAGLTATPSTRRQDAADQVARLHPFAVIEYVSLYAREYADALAAAGVVVFVGSFAGYGAPSGEGASFFTDHPGLVWSYGPTMEQRGGAFGTLSCAELAGRPVGFSGNPGEDGGQRVFGLLHNGDPGRADLDAYTADATAVMSKCGVRFAATHTYPTDAQLQTDPGTAASEAAQNMADFKANHVTTVIQIGSANAYPDSLAAGRLAYFPEWILAGDGADDETLTAALNDQLVCSHAWTMTTFLRRGPYGADPCFAIGKEGDPSGADYDLQLYFCNLYDSVNQFFTGVQVAGPHLTPASMDEGFHAIPAIASSNPRVPACFYSAGDYACVKDAMIEWWDASGQDPSGHGENGCWRVIRGASAISWQTGLAKNSRPPRLATMPATHR